MNEIVNKIGAFLTASLMATFAVIGFVWCLDRLHKWIIKQAESKRIAGGWNTLRLWSISKDGRARILELQVLVQQLNMSLSQKERSYECLSALQGATERRLSEAEGVLAAQEKKIKYAEEQNKELADKLSRAGNAEWGMTEIKRRDEEIDKLARAISELQRISVDSTRVLGIKIMRIGILEEQLRQVVSTAERMEFKECQKKDIDEGLKELRSGIKHIKTLL